MIKRHDYGAILFNLEFDSAGNLKRLVCFCNIALKVIGLASRKIFLHEKPKTLIAVVFENILYENEYVIINHKNKKQKQIHGWLCKRNKAFNWKRI